MPRRRRGHAAAVTQRRAARAVLPPSPAARPLPAPAFAPGTSPSQGARSRPGSSHRRVASPEGGVRGPSLQPTPGEPETPLLNAFGAGAVRPGTGLGSRSEARPGAAGGGGPGAGAGLGAGGSGTPELEGAGRPAQPAAGAPLALSRSAAVQALGERSFAGGGVQQPAPDGGGRIAGRSPRQGRAEPPGWPGRGQAARERFPRLPEVGAATGRLRVEPAAMGSGFGKGTGDSWRRLSPGSAGRLRWSWGG